MTLDHAIAIHDRLLVKAESGDFDAEDLLDAADVINSLGGTIRIKATQLANLEAELSNVRAELQRLRAMEASY